MEAFHLTLFKKYTDHYAETLIHEKLGIESDSVPEKRIDHVKQHYCH